ncbi:MAG: hypothetical protein JW828_07980 [Sedimentisphaerales bacterium]|nr:hypothetical protein [Sedimentisphaerales bacterium]
MGTLERILQRMADNLSDPQRRCPGVMYGTLSSGFDSTAVACLIKKVGVKEVFVSKKSNSFLPGFTRRGGDDGSPVAAALNLEARQVNTGSAIVDEDEIYLLAKGVRKQDSRTVNEIMLFDIFKYIKKNHAGKLTILCNGYHGDTVWGVDVPSECLTDQVIRQSLCGMSLMEYRLVCGFVSAPIPFLLADKIRDIHAITMSEEMKPWRTGKEYDRPIARRIADSMNVPRHLYGIHKKAIVSVYRYPRNPALREEFFRYLCRKYEISRGKIRAYNIFNGIGSVLLRTGQFFGMKLADSSKIIFFREILMPYRMWLWATETLTAKYYDIESVALFRKEILGDGNREAC